MVGLRWWNFIDDEGNSHWVFENKRNQSSVNSTLDDSNTTADTSLFWTALIINPVVWFFLLLVAVFRLNVQYFVSKVKEYSCANYYTP